MADANPKMAADRLEAELDGLVGKVRSAQKMSMVFGLILVVVMFGYFSWLTGKVKDLTTKESVSQLVTQKIADMIPAVAKDLRKQGKEIAPKLLEDAIDKGIAMAPELRKKGEEQVMLQANLYLDRVEKQVDEITDYAYEHHAKEVAGFIKQLNTPEGEQGFEDEIYNLISEPFLSESMKTDIASFNMTLQNMHRHLDKLAAGENLNDEERAERELLGILREVSHRTKLDESAGAVGSKKVEPVMPGTTPEHEEPAQKPAGK